MDGKAAAKARNRTSGAGHTADPETARHHLETAIGRLRANDLASAEESLEAALATQPDQPDALHLLGLVEHKRGAHLEGAAHMERALSIKPGEPAYHNNLAQAYAAAGRVHDAQAHLAHALALKPDYAGAHYNLANLLRAQGHGDAALEHYRRAVALEPNLAGAYVGLAQALLERGEAHEAEATARRASQVAPGSAVCHGTLGAVLLALGDAKGADAACRRAIALDPNLAEPHLTLGNALIAAGAAAEAVEPLRRAVALLPARADAHNSLGVALFETAELEEAERCFRRAIALDGQLAEPESNLGYVLTLENAPEQAIAHCRRAVALDPGFASGWISLGGALLISDDPYRAYDACERGAALAPGSVEALINLGAACDVMARDDEALAAYDRALALDPDNVQARFNRALSRLMVGDYAGGFADYEARLTLGTGTHIRIGMPAWDGAPLPEATLFVHAEQGYGDTLQNLRFVPLAAERVKRVVLGCPAPLLPLLQGAQGIDQVVVLDGGRPQFDAHVALGSLPHILGITLESLPADVPYIPRTARPWALEAPADARLKVGLVWSGGADNRINRRRSCPFAALAPLLALPDVAFFSLQVGPNAADIAAAPDVATLVDLAPRLHDFADTAAVLAGLDLVVTIDTSVAHLVGALGYPVWTMLSYGGDWRYLRARADSPWYPTMRLFRQPEPGDWPAVVAQVVDTLRSYHPNRPR